MAYTLIEIGFFSNILNYMLYKTIGLIDYKVEEVVFGKEPGEWGRPTGEAYVRFGSKQEAEKALQLNGQRIGHRYGWFSLSLFTDRIL